MVVGGVRIVTASGCLERAGHSLQLSQARLLMNKSGSITELLSHPRNSARRGLPTHIPPAVVDRESERGTHCISGVELMLPLDGLAQNLMTMRQWLCEQGSPQQAFRCVRVGSDALVRIHFDEPLAELVEGFCRRFGGHQITGSSGRYGTNIS